MKSMTVRTFVNRFIGGLIICGILLAGCGPTTQSPQATVAPATAAPATAAPATAAPQATEPAAAATDKPTANLEIFSWWTNPGEEDGLFALYDLYRTKYPGIEIVNATVAGAAGINAKQVLKTRMLGGDPPDSFQVHPGAELTATWANTGSLEELDWLYTEQGWYDVLPKDLLDMVTYQGHVYAVNVSVHHGNMLWGNKKLLEENGITKLPETWDEFFKAGEILKAKNIPLLALGDKDKWEDAHLFEDILASVGGAQMYRDLFSGKVSFADPKVTEALGILKRVMQYTNSDHSAYDWGGAAQLMIDGKAATTIMGDWAEGFFIAKNLQPGVDFLYAPTPGTQGIFVIAGDTFGLPKGAKDRANAINWLRVVGSKEGQEAFTVLKGSICARSDCNLEVYPSYLQWSAQDYAKAQLLPSLAHGSAAPEAVASAWNDLLNIFVTDGNVENAQKALVDAAQDLVK
jgi:glucose/mannose transport system substrate-binding protein